MRRQSRSIAEIANEINQVWTPVHIDAKPYLNAMFSVESPNDLYGKDTGKEIIEWFLRHSDKWVCTDAIRLKRELRNLIA